MKIRSSILRLPVLACLTTCVCSGSADVDDLPADLTVMSLQELINLDVTSVAKKAQKLARVPAAVHVITAEDIRRSGATSIPEALRMAPGLHVARIDANKWAISARGFNGRWANKLLVLIDGRSVYSPVFAGVYWDALDTLLEDIDRIEVIRGPGAAIWGANAVNGIINIVTKPAAATQGVLVTAGGGTEDRGFGALRYGGKLGQNARYRVYSKGFVRDDFRTGSESARDGWDFARAGFRMDWTVSKKNSLTLQGDLFAGHDGEIARAPVLEPPFVRFFQNEQRPTGGNLVARLRRIGAGGSESTFQFYADRSKRVDGFGSETVNTFDFDVQHRLTRISRHDIQFGTEARFTDARLELGPGRTFRQAPIGDALLGAFVQDEILLVEDRLSLIVGSKVERTGYAGVEVQPAVQLAWTPGRKHTVWLSSARAARTPALVDRMGQFDIAAFPGESAPGFVTLFGSPDLKSESLVAQEAGYKVNAAGWLSVDLSAFFNAYSGLRTTEPDIPFFRRDAVPPRFVIPLRAKNLLDARAHGVEAAASLTPRRYWKLGTSYSWLRVQARPKPASLDPEVERIETDSPRHQAQLRSYLDLSRSASLDAIAYFAGSLKSRSAGYARQAIPGYARLDARFGWRPAGRVEISVTVQDLLNRTRTEFIEAWGPLANQAEIGRRAYAKITFGL